MSIYSDSRIPYFYIIRHIPSGLMYAGAKWAEDANPENFMKPDGYQTSSNKIASIIASDGLDSFEILRIDTNCDGIQANIYEKSFLEINDCAKSNDWINSHNNTLGAYGSNEFNQMMIKKYGTDNISKTEIGKLKNSNQNLKRIEEGTHNFIDSEWQRNNQYKRVANGNHPFSGGKIQSESNKKRILAGTHNFMLEENRIAASNRMKTEYMCKFCTRIIKGPSIVKHEMSCKSNPNMKISTPNLLPCKCCGKLYKFGAGMANHEKKCKLTLVY